MKRILLFFLCLSTTLQAQFIVNTGININNSTSLFVDGAWQNNGGTFKNDGTIYTTASWVNAGTMDNASTGGFTLDYSIDQNFSLGTNSVKIGSLEKRGTGVAQLTGNVLVKQSLILKNGKFQVSSNDTLSVRSTTVVSPEGGFVEGYMAKVGTGTFTLPVGLNTDYLPVKFYASSSARVVVKVTPAPGAGTYSAGDAVESLFGFPYDWNVQYQSVSDTADFVEVQIPNALVSSNVILTQKVSGLNEFEALGISTVTPSGGVTSFKSFSPSRQSTIISLGKGFAGSADGDRIILEEFLAATQGTSWTKRQNWGNANFYRWGKWFGVTTKGGRVVSINLPNNNIIGDVPASFSGLITMKSFDLSGNKISSLPDLSGMTRLTQGSVNVSNNALDFYDLEPIQSVLNNDVGSYGNQAPFTPDSEIPVEVNNPVTVTPTITNSATNDEYQWQFKPYFNARGKFEPAADFSDIPNETGTSYSTDLLKRFITQPTDPEPVTNPNQIGEYRLKITNTDFQGLEIFSGVITVDPIANINGEFNFGTDPVQLSTRPATFKEMALLQVTTTGGYDTIRYQSLDSPGKFLFSGVPLRDYLIGGWADPLLPAYQNAVATWYKDDANNGVIYWEEADTIFLTDNINSPGLTIKSGVKPTDPNLGAGIISGKFTDPFNDAGGRTNKNNKVSYGVSARRVQRAGRGTADITLSAPIAYVYSNDEGFFNIDGLDPKDLEYRLNIQYPGYPMDPDSYIDIVLEDNLFGRQVGVDAEVINGKINVRKLIITGWEEENHSMTAYPNPTVEYLYITGKPAQAVTFKVYDSNGRVLNVNSRWDNQKAQWELDVRTLPTGLYILDVVHSGKTEKLRIAVK